MRKHFNHSTNPHFSGLLCPARCHSTASNVDSREGLRGEKAAHTQTPRSVPARQLIPSPGGTREGFGGEKAAHTQTPRSVPAPQLIPSPGGTREGFGGEKAARKSASLPVPTIPQILHQPIIAAQQSLRSASGEVEQKREWVFPQKSGKSRSRFCGSFSPHRPTAAESDSDPYAAPAPCRTQGVRGAADTPPASHDPATPEKQRKRPQPPTILQRSPTRTPGER